MNPRPYPDHPKKSTRGGRPLRILSIPGRRMYKLNPFTEILASALERRGHRVDDIDLKQLVRTRYHVVLIHWPENFATLPLPVSLAKVALLHLLLLILRLRGAVVVWLAHDGRSMLKRNRRLAHWHMNGFVRWVHALVFLSESSRECTFARYPQLTQKPSLLSFHPVPLIDTDAQRARDAKALPIKREKLGFIGDIRPSKGLLEFLTLCANGEIALRLRIVGACSGGSREALIAAAVDQMNERGSDVRWLKRRPSTLEFDAHMRAMDVVLLPYLWGWNSGVALQALFARRRVLATDLPIFRELRDALGPYWIQTYDGTVAGLNNALDLIGETQITEADDNRLDAFLRRSTWGVFAESVERLFYRTASQEDVFQGATRALPSSG